ncbi:mitochondrial inner membrane protein [Lyophyllum atratum]|nr:mitochondrial inner membrane protein [Lyophyllum atratum]
MASSLLVRSSLPRALAQRSLVRSAAIQARHATGDAYNAAYVPGGPVYKGTVNDPTTFPPPSRSHGSYHWAFERLLAASLVPMTAAAFVTSGTAHPVVDGLLGVSLVMHSHLGFDSILVDYVHKRKFPRLGPTVTWALRATTAAVLVGVYQFNTNDIGLTELIVKVWHA